MRALLTLQRPFACPQYNMVKLIPSKEHSEMFGQYREPANWFHDDEPSRAASHLSSAPAHQTGELHFFLHRLLSPPSQAWTSQ